MPQIFFAFLFQHKLHETKKHLSDDFDIDIITIPELGEKYEKLVSDRTSELILDKDKVLTKREKEAVRAEVVKKMGIHDTYDMLYFYLHTSLQYDFIQYLTREIRGVGCKTAAIITQKVILKDHWGKTKERKVA